jgi:predicted Zn finger-like uncharacterized protein
MNIRCPHCQTVFRVNPERIPPSGVRAKCARCGDSFLVTPPSASQKAPMSQSAPTAATVMAGPSPAVRPPTPAVPTSVERPAARSNAAVTTEAAPPPVVPDSPGRSTSPLAAPRPAPVQAPAAAARAPAPAAGAGIGARDPRSKAERLARALVSDIVAYNPDRWDRSLTSGTLRSEFREEIMKSWEEYKVQVGDDVAKSTPFFREALNSILAKGQKVF